MLRATKTSLRRSRYSIDVDGRLVTVWDSAFWTTGGRFELERLRYTVRANMWGSKYAMVGEDGAPVATADHVGRKRWTVEAGNHRYEFQRASIWRREQELRSGGERVGSVRRPSLWRNDVVADLPGLPLPVQIFALAVILTGWDRSNASASAEGAVGAGA
jgi:hypothetical protein